MRLRRPLLPVLALVAWPAASALAADSPEALRQKAAEYYQWRNEQFPVASSDQGLHTWDDRLTDYSAAAVAARREHVTALAGGGPWHRRDGLVEGRPHRLAASSGPSSRASTSSTG